MVPVHAITSVVTKRRWRLRSTLTVASEAGSIEFRVHREVAEAALITLTELVDSLRSNPVSDSIAARSGTIADEVMSLRWLQDAGILTAAEFDEQCTRLLSCLDARPTAAEPSTSSAS
jgi:hypothetical protein